MNTLNRLALEIQLLAVEQPVADAGPFAELWNKLGGVLIWGATIGGVVAIVWAAVMLAWERLDPSREATSSKAILGAVIGGGVAASAAQIINWAYEI